MAAEGIPVEFDTTKAQAFAGRLLTALNDAALCLMSRPTPSASRARRLNRKASTTVTSRPSI